MPEHDAAPIVNVALLEDASRSNQYAVPVVSPVRITGRSNDPR